MLVLFGGVVWFAEVLFGAAVWLFVDVFDVLFWAVFEVLFAGDVMLLPAIMFPDVALFVLFCVWTLFGATFGSGSSGTPQAESVKLSPAAVAAGIRRWMNGLVLFGFIITLFQFRYRAVR